MPHIKVYRQALCVRSGFYWMRVHSAFSATCLLCVLLSDNTHWMFFGVEHSAALLDSED